jgi:glycine/serine hydroxymethyltransferase
MREAEMREIGALIVDGIAARGDEDAQERIRERVAGIVDRFPVPGLPSTLVPSAAPA